MGPPLLPDNPDTARRLREKHPQALPARPSLVGLGPPSRAAVPDIACEQVVTAVRGFRRGSAAGPSGLRGDHLREALGTAHSDEVTTHLCAVVRLLINGEASLELSPHLAGATLHALPKDGGDVRPIAVGETLRRLAAKCLCSALKEPARAALWPLQVGVASRLGTETAIHTARQWALRSSGHVDKVFLKVDFQNAFNTIDRAAFLRLVRLRLPGLAPYAEWCYDRHSRLLFHGSPLTSEAGVQQGDPLGPLLFALALQPVLEAARAGPAGGCPELLFAYLDDVCIAGGSRQVAAAFARLAAAGRHVGLQLKVEKCELVLCGGPDASVDRSLFPAAMRVNSSGAFSLLGAPIGGPPFTEAFTQAERVEKVRPLLQALSRLQDPQTGLLLLRHCASFCKMVFALRVTPPTLLGQAPANFDNEVRGCPEQLCTGPLPDQAWQQASLCTSAGGLGLRSAVAHAAAAYVASLAAVQDMCGELDPGFRRDWDGSGFRSAADAVNQMVLPADCFPVPVPPNLRQQTLSKALDRALLQRLAVPGQGREAYRAHLQLLQQPRAGAWLHAPPSEPLGLYVEPILFRTMVRLRLRLEVIDADNACPLCDATMDQFGDHARTCACGGDRTKRHNRLRAVLAARAQAGGLSPEVEKPGLLPPRTDEGGNPEDGVRGQGGRRPADVYIPQWGLHGPAAFDLAVTCGLRPGQLGAVAADGGRPAADYEARKRSHLDTQRLCEQQGIQFVPLVVESNGGWAPSALRAWQDLARAVAARSGEAASVEADRLFQALAVTLQRENARAVLRRAPISGEPTAGLDDP